MAFQKYLNFTPNELIIFYFTDVREYWYYIGSSPVLGTESRGSRGFLCLGERFTYFATYEIEYSDRFFEDIQAHKKAGQKSVLEKINQLIDELREHPFAGTGNPKPMKYNKKGQWSGRIIHKLRLIYMVKEQ